MQVATHGAKVVVLGTGGTIAARASSPADTIGYVAGEIGVAQLLAMLPGQSESKESEGAIFITEQIAQIDSKDMDFSVWQALVARCDWWLRNGEVTGIVITHGTDTLEETAFFLQCVLSPAKPVVLACAMRPATALTPDGPQNLLDALQVASFAGAQGVVAVCAGELHAARDVQKDHTHRTHAFSSGDAGPLGFVEAQRLRLLRNWPLAGSLSAKSAIDTVASLSCLPRVELIFNHAGADGDMVDALLADTRHPPVQGLVVAGTGNGTISRRLEAALRRAMASGVRVVRSTRCAYGQVIPSCPSYLADLPAIADSNGLSPAKARVALMLELAGIVPVY